MDDAKSGKSKPNSQTKGDEPDKYFEELRQYIIILSLGLQLTFFSNIVLDNNINFFWNGFAAQAGFVGLNILIVFIVIIGSKILNDFLKLKRPDTNGERKSAKNILTTLVLAVITLACIGAMRYSSGMAYEALNDEFQGVVSQSVYNTLKESGKTVPSREDFVKDIKSEKDSIYYAVILQDTSETYPERLIIFKMKDKKKTTFRLTKWGEAHGLAMVTFAVFGRNGQPVKGFENLRREAENLKEIGVYFK